MIAYPIEGSLGFAFRNSSCLKGKVGLLKEVDAIPEGWGELTEKKWGAPLPRFIDIYTGPHGNAVIVHADKAWAIDEDYWSLWQSVATRDIAWEECEKAGLSVERAEIPAL